MANKIETIEFLRIILLDIVVIDIFYGAKQGNIDREIVGCIIENDRDIVVQYINQNIVIVRLKCKICLQENRYKTWLAKN